MEMNGAPMEWGEVAGGPVVVIEDTMDDDEGEGEESLTDLATRVRELESMRVEDFQPETPTEKFSPTELQEDDNQVVSPLMKLKELVEKQSTVTSSAGESSMAMEVDKDEYNMIGSESQKLKQYIPDTLRMPWEKGFAGVVLTGKAGVLPLECLQEGGRSAKAMDIEVDVEVQQKEEVKLKTSHTTKDSVRLPWARAQAEERDKVLAGWMVVIAEAGKHSRGREMIENSGEEVLDDVFAKKENGTLQVRLSAMLLYVRWARAQGLRPFPLDEEVCYNYVDQLRRDGAPATRASSFRSALAFCKGTIQLLGVDEVLQSTRITGSAHRSFLTKRVLKQRDALTVHQVNILERVVCEDTFPVQDRIFAGHCLVCIYGRLRFGDSQGIQHEPVVEGGYFEGGTSTHKTDSIAGRACRVLPVVAPELGVTGVAWAAMLLKLRNVSGLRAMPGRPFLPTPVPGGGWSAAKLSTSEASVWLCEILKKYSLHPGQLSNVGAHSLKATALSWMAKAMVAEKIRRLMGYHVKPKDKTVLIYSRDALAAGLQILTKLVSDIHQLKFRPDAPRNQRFVGMEPGTGSDMQEPQGDEQDEDILPRPGDKWAMHEVPTPEKSSFRLVEADHSSSEDEESVNEGPESEDERTLEAVVRARLGPPKKSNAELYRHGITGTIHHGSSTEGKLACGRPISGVMIKLTEEVHALGSRCKVCEGYAR